jgi:hypothetical protein
MIKIERISNQLVKIGDATFPTGDVTMVQTDNGNHIKLVLKNGAYSTQICNDKFGQYANSAGVKYTTFAAASAAIAAAIVSGDGVSGVISDKGTVTQATSKTTAVVSNTYNTKITTVALTDAADAAFSFTFTNSKIAATSNVLPTVDMNGGTGKAVIHVTPAAGSATVTVTNVGTAAFNSAIKIGLVVL